MQNKDIQIAIVEDDTFVSLDLVDRLESLGFSRLKVFDSGEGFIAEIESLNPKIVLMDVELAGDLDGIETILEVQKTRQFPVIYLTDHVDDQTFQRALKTSPTAFLHKPFVDKQIAQNIEIALSQEVPEEEQEKSSVLVPDGLFAYKSEGEYLKLNLIDIRFLQAERAYCKVGLDHDVLTVSRSMKTVLKVLHKSSFRDMFIQVHRSYAINKKHITGFNGRTIHMGKHRIPTTEYFISDLKTKFFTI